MAVMLRLANSDDFGPVCDLFHNKEELFLVYPEGKYPLTIKQMQALIKRRLEPTVLLCDGRIAGFGALYGLRPEKSVFIGNIVIDQSIRGKGLGKTIVSHLMDVAFRKYELPVVRISVYSHNVGALLLYGKLGFKPYAVQEKTDQDGERVALLHLRLKYVNHSPREIQLQPT